MELLIRFGIPAFLILIAIWLSKYLLKKKYQIKRWHGIFGIIFSVCTIFLNIALLQKTPFAFPFLLVSMILIVFSFALFKAAERLENKSKPIPNQDK